MLDVFWRPHSVTCSCSKPEFASPHTMVCKFLLGWPLPTFPPIFCYFFHECPPVHQIYSQMWYPLRSLPRIAILNIPASLHSLLVLLIYLFSLSILKHKHKRNIIFWNRYRNIHTSFTWKFLQLLIMWHCQEKNLKS